MNAPPSITLSESKKTVLTPVAIAAPIISAQSPKLKFARRGGSSIAVTHDPTAINNVPHSPAARGDVAEGAIRVE
jgi:hypothetical protein